MRTIPITKPIKANIHLFVLACALGAGNLHANVVDISTILTPGPQGTSQGIVIDSTVGAGNSGRLVGSTMTFWGSGGFSVPLDLNGNTLIIDSGNGNTMNARGPISGDGVVHINGPSVRIQGSTGNTYTGSTIASRGAVSLEKSSGDALCGSISVTADGLVWTANDQINDASDVTLANTTYLNLAGHSDTINELHLVTGSAVQTGAGGVLSVAKLFLNGVQQPEVAYIAGDGFVTGSGYIAVGGSGPPVILVAPPAPTTPTPSDAAATVNPAFLAKLDWGDCAGATSYDVYLWPASGPKPASPSANVSVSEYTLTSAVNSLTAYTWQVVAKNSAGDTPGPEWTFTTLDRRDISDATTPAEANPNNGVYIDSVVGSGNTGRLVGITRTIWWSGGFTVALNLNGNTLEIATGGNFFNITGAISGSGLVRFKDGGSTRVGGSTGNTYTGTTEVIQGPVSLEKSSGNALCGAITVFNTSTLVWAANDQIDDTAAVSLVSSGSMLNLAGHSDIIFSLSLATGAGVNTGTGGVLTASALTVNGVVMPGGIYTASDSTFVTGSGSLVVTGAGLTYDAWTAVHAGGQPPDMDYDNDGVTNGVEFFMGAPDGFTANPGVINGKVTWPHVNAVTAFEVQVSDNLADWVPANPADIDTTTDPAKVTYTLPPGAVKKFCRLVVTP